MKNKIFLMMITAFFMLIASCSDIVDADKNINKTKIEYSKVLAEQEKGVIMPLKTGNKYYYKVTQYFTTGTVFSVTYDSIVIKNEVTINGEKWFNVSFPMLREDGDVLLTNTNMGLWYKCDQCSNTSYLLGHYPITNSKQANGLFKFSAMLNDGNILTDSCQRYIYSGMVNNNILNFGESYFYEQSFKLLKTSREFVHTDCNFIENTGLIRFRTYWIDLMDSGSVPKLDQLYELTDKPGDELQVDTNDCKHVGSYPAGEIKVGDTKTITVSLTNNESSTVHIVNIYIIPSNQNTNIEIKPPVTLPLTLTSNSTLNVAVKISPLGTGQINGFLIVESDSGCWYNIQIYGKATD